MKKLNSCDLCENKNFEFLFKGFDRMHNVKGMYLLYQCKKCGLIFINPQPDDKEISRHYPAGKYYSFEKNELPKLEKLLYKIYYSKKRNLFLKLFFLPLKPAIRTTKIVPSGKILDVGSGAGSYLLLMQEFGMDCYGVEPGKFDKKFAKQKGLKIFHGSLKEAKFPSNYFDAITLNHVFEHINNPTETMKELYRILKPKGTLVIATPQSDCLAYKLFGRYWVQLDVPRHLFTYSTSTLKKYAEKIGFKIEKIRYNSLPFQFLGSFMYFTNKLRKKQIYLSEKKFYNNKILFLLFLPLAHICNFLKIGDQVEILLAK